MVGWKDYSSSREEDRQGGTPHTAVGVRQRQTNLMVNREAATLNKQTH
jgi:hypothetical protein